MLDRLISFALRQRLFVLGGVLSLVIAGAVAMNRIAFDAYPDLTGTTVEVITAAPGMAHPRTWVERDADNTAETQHRIEQGITRMSAPKDPVTTIE